MNTQLEKLFDTYDMSAKDRYDFTQVYNLLPGYKKVKALENFESIIASLKSLRSEMLIEQEILFGKTLQNIEERIQQSRQRKISKNTKTDIELLKNTLG